MDDEDGGGGGGRSGGREEEEEEEEEGEENWEKNMIAFSSSAVFLARCPFFCLPRAQRHSSRFPFLIVQNLSQNSARKTEMMGICLLVDFLSSLQTSCQVRSVVAARASFFVFVIASPVACRPPRPPPFPDPAMQMGLGPAAASTCQCGKYNKKYGEEALSKSQRRNKAVAAPLRGGKRPSSSSSPHRPPPVPRCLGGSSGRPQTATGEE